MVFASICEHASSAFIFASLSSGQIRLASSEHFIKYLMTSNEQFENLPHSTDNNCNAKTYFYSFNSTQIVSISELNLNGRQLFFFSLVLI